jgi:threonine dehydratase
VSDDDLARSVALLLTRLKIVAEPTGALAPAAALSGSMALDGRTAVAVVSGGNVDPAVLARCCDRG